MSESTGSDSEQPDVPTIDVSEVADDATILDVRESDEWQAGHAPGAVLSPLANLPTSLGNVPHGEQIPVICRSGGRSSKAVEWLQREGFDAVNVDGGMRAWAKADKPMVSENDKEPQVI
ncbi:MAG: rhodanese-like domain-containing protein [Ornithinimicrobium sp.]|uniref:rhodanese-like domain-containing protein n=1 Tax=Ornithinimicrobium sp. TaxID=1977084 RepID=UPI003D9AED0E